MSADIHHVGTRSIFIREDRANRFWNRIWFLIMCAGGVFFVACLVGAAMLVATEVTEQRVRKELQAKADASRPAWSCKEALRICESSLRR